MRAVPLLVLLLVAALPAAADARIVIGASIHGLRIGDRESRFRTILGAPDGPRDFGEEPADYGLGFRGGRYHAIFDSGRHRATLISTTNPRERTPSGVGPGVSAKLARARLHGERCTSVYDADRQLDVTDCEIRDTNALTSVYLFDHEVFEVDLQAAT